MSRLLLKLPVAAVLLGLSATPAHADWPSTNATKWVQFPDGTGNGIDVLAAQQAAGALPIILADDFLCKRTGPVTDIHIWTSWIGDKPNPNIPITLSFWSDVPAITNGTVVIPSHPGSVLWSQTFGPGGYAIKAWKTADELFWSPEPAPQGTILGQDHFIWLYNFYPDPAKLFFQQGSATAPVVYWLSMTAGANIAQFGWKTATNHWNDDAVFGHVNANGPVGDWQELRDPKSPTARSLDLAFALTMPNDVPPTPQPTNKWAQYPDQFNGYDVHDTFPNILADDFNCTAASTITNIQIWGSYLNDANPDPNTRFILGIWSDVPGGSANNGFSKPGNLLWSETFGAGTYGINFYTNGQENFYDPNTGQVTAETKIWLYNFNPKQPFCQKGSANQPLVYWLSVQAVTPTPGPVFGWKTSTNHWNDDAVYGHTTAAGGPLGDWKDLHDPRTGITMDLAFRLNGGPPSTDCEPNRLPKFVQWPDPSTNGLDVLATYPKILGDDFLCKVTGPINGVRVWGSWLGDQVDPNATFQLGLWTDVPAVSGTVSHPGQLLCSQIFYPAKAVGTSLMRYNSQLYAANVRETFYDPDLPGLSGFIGNDTQIWQYDFYPRLNCWYQRGTSTSNRVYWLSLTATSEFKFGWKTSTNHWNDDGVWGHLDASGKPLADWKDLRDPRTGKSLDLSFALRSFPIVGINKDIKNVTTVTASGIRIIVAGTHEITWHYDDAPPWPNFAVSYAGGNTVLEWTGKTVAPNTITHVGFEMSGTAVNIVSMSWLSATGTVIGVPVQVNFHTWGNGTAVVINNNLSATQVIPNGGTIEFFADPTPLDLMNPGATGRNPLATFTLPVQPEPIMPGGATRIPLPPAPPGAQYLLLILNLMDAQGNQATMDFLQLPLDAALRPTLMPMGLTGSSLGLGFGATPGRTYRLLSSPSLTAPNWSNTDETTPEGDMGMFMVPVSANSAFYQVILLPE